MYGAATRSNPEILCSDRLHLVHCPNQKITARVTASRWQMQNGKWTAWRIVDCPLLQAGLIDCDMSCLCQLQRILDPEDKAPNT